jgi:anaerobic magnesium-protoporphyrin IX monomethyl ester cyclase
MKIGLFIAVVEERDEDWSVGPPLGLGYLSSYLKKYGEGYETVIRRNLDELIEEKPDLVGISCSTYSYNVAIRAAKRVKSELGVPCIIGGTHITAMPQRLHPIFDAAVLGEGEKTFFDLCELFKATHKLDKSDLTNVKGILFHGEHRLHTTPNQDRIEELDRIPPPDRDEFGDQWGAIKKHAHVMTSRGCPYKCTFCSTVRHWGQSHRFFSPEYVVSEVEDLVHKWGAEHVIIFDDLFIGKTVRLREIQAELQKRGLIDAVHFTVSARANQIKEANIEALRDLNIRTLTMGFESAAPRVLDYLGKNAVKPETLQHCVDLCKSVGINVAPSFIIGSPCETRDDLKMTFDFILDNLDVLSALVIGPLMVLPATPIWDDAEKRNLIDDKLTGVVLEPVDLEDDKKFFFEKYIYMNEHMSREEFWMHYQFAKRLEYIVWKNHDQRKQIHREISDEELANISWKRLTRVMGGKIAKRLVHGKTPNQNPFPSANTPIGSSSLKENPSGLC